MKKKVVTEVQNISVWEELLRKSVVTEDQLDSMCKGKIDKDKLRAVIRKYPMRINPYYLTLIKKKDDPIWKQCIPDERELSEPEGFEDPLCEERDSPVPGLTHRYPDRVLLLVSNQCSMYCRFCTRKRKVGHPFKRITKYQILKGIDYIRGHKEVRDVVVSGGDPFLLSDSYLNFILKELRAIPHLEIIRIDTRTPCALPQRITPELCNVLKKYHPLYVIVHFEHPDEITQEAEDACAMLANAGIPLLNQSVLMKWVNDDVDVMKKLVHRLLQIRVKPYYIYVADLARGTHHFRTTVDKGIEIMKGLIGHTSGLAVPRLVIDAQGGGGKIPVLPEYILTKSKEGIILKNYKNSIHELPEDSIIADKEY